MDTILQVICVQFLFFFFCGYTHVNGCTALSPKYGTVTPDRNFLVGSTIEVNCTLFHNKVTAGNKPYDFNSSQLYFKFNNQYIKDLEIIDPLTAKLRLENSTINDTGTYYCFLKHPSNPDPFLICSTQVTVGYLPQPVEWFKCISIHYRNLTCDWQPPFNPITTKYTLYDYIYYFPPGVYAGNRSCPHVLTPTSCQWRVDTKPNYRKQPKTLYFYLEGKNTLGKTGQYIHLDHYKIVLPDKTDIMLAPNTTTCNSTTVHWLKPGDFKYETSGPKLMYELQYKPVEIPSEEWKKMIIEGDLSYKLVGLNPYTVYSIRLRCKTVEAVEEYMWSPFSTFQIKTLPDIPYVVPECLNEAVYVENVRNLRNVTIYWKPVPKANWNGENFEYHVKCVSTYISRYKREMNIVKVYGSSSSITILNLDQSTAYKFYIYSSNKEGLSSNSSVITLPKSSAMKNIIPQNIGMLYDSQRKYEILWKAPVNGDAVVKYTIFRFKSILSIQKQMLPIRDSDLDWKVIHAKPGKQEYKEELSFDDGNYLFAIAATTLNSTSGMQWVSCTEIYNNVLKKIENIELKPQNSTSIRVSWNFNCDVLKYLIKYYTISYCKIVDSCSSHCIDESSYLKIEDSKISSYNITGLVPFTLYKVTMSSFSERGQSENSSAKCSKTMTAAPSGPPWNVTVLNIINKTITLSWNPPLQPNGIISHYVIYYNQYTLTVKEKETVFTLRDNILYFTNYTIQIEACVENYCSPRSTPVFAATGISEPERMDPPNLEVLNATYIRISWKRPQIANGPINYYNITVQSNTPKDDKTNITVPGNENSTFATLQCSDEEQGATYHFRIYAVNRYKNNTLQGPGSESVRAKLCYLQLEEIEFPLIIGVTVGGALGLGTLVFVLYLLVRWMKNKMDYIKNIKVELPTGLNSENPSHSYEHFKHGLIQKGSDSSVSPRTYGRLNSYASDDGDSKDRHDSGNSHYSNLSTEELLQKRSSEFGRNPSGDSNTFSRGHDSISSSATNRTQLSSDSGTEMDLQAPPSPDTVFPDSVSSSTTPKAFTKSGLPVVEEGHDSDSKDSGLEKEGTTEASPTITDLEIDGHYTRFAGYLNNNSRPFTNSESQTVPAHQPAYSKFGVTSPSSPCIPVSGQNGALGLLDRSLANSEPSVIDFDGSSDSEPVVNQSISPYSRYGLARSVGAELDRPVFPATGYSKFGVVHHAFNLDSTNRPPLEPISSQCSELGIRKPHLQEKKPYVTTNFAAVLLDKNKPYVQGPEYASLGIALNSNKDFINLKSPVTNPLKAKVMSQCPKDYQENHTDKPGFNPDDTCSDLNGYSKFGIQPEPHKPAKQPYIGFQQAKELSDSVPAAGYSKIDLQPHIASQPDLSIPKPVNSQNNVEAKSTPSLSRTLGIAPTGTKPKIPVHNVHNGYVPHSQMEISKPPVSPSVPASYSRKNSNVPDEDVSSDILPIMVNEHFAPSSNLEGKCTMPPLTDGNASATGELSLLSTVPGSHLKTESNCTSNSGELQPQLNAPPIIKPPTSTDEPEPKVTLVCNGPKLHYHSKIKAQSNGYVPMSDILGSDVTHDNYKVEILPDVLQNGLSLSESDI